MRNFLIIFKVVGFRGTFTARRIYTLRETLQVEVRPYASP